MIYKQESQLFKYIKRDKKALILKKFNSFYLQSIIFLYNIKNISMIEYIHKSSLKETNYYSII